MQNDDADVKRNVIMLQLELSVYNCGNSCLVLLSDAKPDFETVIVQSTIGSVLVPRKLQTELYIQGYTLSANDRRTTPLRPANMLSVHKRIARVKKLINFMNRAFRNCEGEQC